MKGVLRPPPVPPTRPDPLCEKCVLRETATTICVSARSSSPVAIPPIDVLFVGEAPGPDEDRSGVAFIGKSGERLDTFLRGKIPGRSYWITNAVRCFPGFRGDTISKPKKKNMEACFGYLDREVRALRPRVIVAMGNYAISATTGMQISKCKVTTMAGIEMASRWDGVKVIPMEHPAYTLRDPHLLDLWESRWDVLRQHLDIDPVRHQEVEWSFVTDPALIERHCDRFVDSQRVLAIDIETTGLEYASDAILMVGVADRHDRAVVFPVLHARVRRAVARLLAEAPGIVLHNAVFDLSFLCHHYDLAEKIRARVIDTKALSYLDNERHPRNLRDLVSTYVPEYHGYKSATELAGVPLWEMETEPLAERCAIDCAATLALAKALRSRLDPARVRMYDRIIAPALSTLVEMKLEGVRIDRDGVERLIDRELRRQERCEAAVLDQVPADMVESFNMASTPQRAELLERLGLDSVIEERQKVSQRVSTRKDDLEKYTEAHPVIRPLVDWSSSYRQVRQFYRPVLDFIERDGLLHPGWSWGGRAFAGEGSGTPTGRLSTAKPNLMNPPREFRKVIVSKHGPAGEIVGADYSQQELRIVVSLANETGMIEEMAGGADPHDITSKRTGTERGVAKRINFGILFGAGEEKLTELGLTLAQAREALRRADAAFPSVPAWKADLKMEMLRTGRIEGVWGQCLHVPDIYSYKKGEQVHAANRGINFKVANAGAIMTIYAMVLIQERFKARRMRSRVVLQLHDYIGSDCPAEEADEAEAVMRECMVDRMAEICADWLKVPLRVDFKRGRSMAGSTLRGKVIA